MTEKVVLLIDMDGVLCNWYQRVYDTYRLRYPNRVVVKPKDATEFYCETLYPEEHQKDVMAISKERGFYQYLNPMPGAIEAMDDLRLNCRGFVEPYICTSPELEFSDMMCHTEKARWVQAILGDFWLKRLIITKDKTLVQGDFLIDDKPHVTGMVMPNWKQIHYTQPYTPEGVTQLEWSKWTEFKEYLKSLVSETQGSALELV